MLKSDYWEDDSAREAFKAFMLRIFSLDFSEWEAAGYWDDAYTPFSFFEGDELVANVCIYLLDAIVEGKRTRLAQVSGVGTLPRWRRRGLGRELLEIGLDWARGRHEGVFLFANEEATTFYEGCGFRATPEYLMRAEVEPVSRVPGAVKLDCRSQHDLDKIYQRSRSRAPISNVLGVLSPRLLMFHALRGLRNHAHEILELDCIAFYERQDDRLTLYDVVGPRVPRFAQLYPYIRHERDRIVEFHFSTDRLGLEKARAVSLPQCESFVQDPFPVREPLFPFTARA
jgi:GNAT superfamily N-acetyltransferase